MSTTPDDDIERDAWLRAALRHAPDADAAPPPALRQAILREARAAASMAAPLRSAAAVPGPSPINAIAGLWNWLARAPVAAGFASLMVATLAGMVWWGRPIDSTVDGPIQVATAPPGAAVRAPAAESMAAAPPADVKPAAAARRDAPAATGPAIATARTTQAPPARPVSEARVADAAINALPPAGNELPAVAKPAPAAAKAAQSDSVAPTERLEQAREQPGHEVVARAARPAVGGSDREQNLPPASAELSAATTLGPEPSAVTRQPPSAAPTSADRQLALERTRQAAAQEPLVAGAAAPASTGAPASSGSAAAGIDLAGLLLEIRRQPGRWTWQRDGAAPRPADAALQAWLVQAEAATRGRWQSAATLLPGAGDARSRQELRLLAGGRPAAVLRLGLESVSIEWPGGGASTRVAALDAAAATTLRAALDRLGE